MIVTQRERIGHMEQILDEVSAAAEALSAVLDRYDALQPAICELEAYYSGPQWMIDYEADCAGAFPKEMKRGVLSEDAVYDLLELRDALHARMARIAGRG